MLIFCMFTVTIQREHSGDKWVKKECTPLETTELLFKTLSATSCNIRWATLHM